MKPRHAPPAFPEALDGDDDDVAWALQTGGVEWSRGAHGDALVWLKRAIDAAREHRRLNRARDLEFRGRTLQVALEVGWVAAPQPPPPPKAPEAVEDDDDIEMLDPDALEEVDVDLEVPSLRGARVEAVDADDLVEEITLEQTVVEELEVVETFDDTEVLLLPSEAPPTTSMSPNGMPFEPAPSIIPSAPPTYQDPPVLPSMARAPFEPAPSFRAPSEFPPPLAPSEPTLASAELPSELPQSYRAPFDTITSIMPNSDPMPSEKTLYDKAPSMLPPSDPPAQFFEPASLVPPDPADEEPTERDLESTGGAPVPRPAPPPPTPPPPTPPPPTPPPPSPSQQELPPPSTSGLFPVNDTGAPIELLEVRSKPELPPEDGEVPHVAGIQLASVAGLQDLPEDAQAELARRADIQTLNPDEEISGFGLALVVEGSVAVMPTIADVAAAEVLRGQPVFSQGHLAEGVAVRVVAGRKGARVAVWSPADFEAAVRDCPWVGDELKAVGDRFQALAGVAMGPLGESLDDMLRTLVIDRCEVRLVLEGELVAEKGKPLRGMFVLGGGHLDITSGAHPGAAVVESLSAGDFLFASQILQAAPAPADARAGKGGALVLFASRPVAHELMVSVPPLLEIFAR